MSALLRKLELGLGHILEAGMVICGLSLALLMVAEVILRYWLELPFLGIEEVTVLLGLWLYFLSAAYVTREDAHIRGGIAELVIRNPVLLDGVRFTGTIVCLLASCVFFYYAVTYALFTISTNRASSYLRWPTGFWVASMAVGFVFIVLYFLLQAIRQWRHLRRLR